MADIVEDAVIALLEHLYATDGFEVKTLGCILHDDCATAISFKSGDAVHRLRCVRCFPEDWRKLIGFDYGNEVSPT